MALHRFYSASSQHENNGKAKRKKTPPKANQKLSPPVSISHWSLDQLKRGKVIVDSCHALATYLYMTPHEDTSTDVSFDAEDRRLERRLLKVQLHSLHETLRDLFTRPKGVEFDAAS